MADPLSVADFYDLATPTDLALSPSGDRVAFTVDEFDAQEDERLTSVFVAPADGSGDPHRLTQASSASAPAWSPDGTKLAVLAKRETGLAQRVEREPETDDDDATDESATDTGDEGPDEDGEDESGSGDEDDEPKNQVWLFDLERGGDAVRITDRSEGVREFDWSPGGDRLVIAARDPTEEQAEKLEERREGGPIEIERLQHKADGIGWLDDVRTYLFVVDLDTGEERRLDEAYGAGASEPLSGLQPAWDERGIAFLTNRSEWPDDSMYLDLFLVDPEESDPDIKQITDEDLFVREHAWSPDGDKIAFVGGPPRNWYRPRRVHVADLEAGTVESRTDSLDRTVAFQGNPTWIDDEQLVCAFADEGWTRFVRVSTDEEPERVFDWLPRDRTIQLFDGDGGTISMAVSDPQDGVDVYSIGTDDLEAGPADPDPRTRLTRLNESLVDEHVMPAVRRVEYENEDGETIEGIVYLPPDFDPEGDESAGEEADTLPLVVSIHGGPMSYDAPGFRFDLAYLVGQGYAVLKPNYRGSTSYGRQFSEALRGSRGTLETDDVTSGVEHLVEAGWVDPDRTFVTGFSYGGITTAHVLTRVDTFAAGAAEHGIYDFYSNFGTDDNHLWHEDEFGLPWEEPDTYRDISSITRVDEIETPLLITAGENDWRCPPTQAEQLYVSVKKQGIDAKLVIYQDEHHSITEPDRAIHRLETITDWFESHDPAVDE